MFWLGLLLVACGVFLLVYGGKLFRFALAVALFVLGFSLASWLLAGQTLTLRLIISLVTGGVLAIAGFALVRAALHIAGALLGAVLALIILSVVPATLPDIVGLVVIIAAAALVGFFGNRLGDWVIILATTLVGAYAVLWGLTRMFPVIAGVTTDYTSAYVPLSAPAIVIFLTVFAIGVLAQLEIRRVRGRYVN
jgi:hypothetical protein